MITLEMAVYLCRYIVTCVTSSAGDLARDNGQVDIVWSRLAIKWRSITPLTSGQPVLTGEGARLMRAQVVNSLAYCAHNPHVDCACAILSRVRHSASITCVTSHRQTAIVHRDQACEMWSLSGAEWPKCTKIWSDNNNGEHLYSAFPNIRAQSALTLIITRIDQVSIWNHLNNFGNSTFYI